MIGLTLGPYRILSKLGAGGMGEVYRAHDTRLEREVAIKILPEAFAGDADRLARFAREAQMLAALNHPNVAQIYGLEGHALVMELVDGDDLSTRIGRGPLLLADALLIARQMADALEAAHERGIVHRDLKPANVKVRDDGTVKVLDFGLAKAFDAVPSDAAGASVTAGPMASPTMTARGTEIGLVLGTAAYMAPEQARGRPVDRRADIWAFGCVLFEMLAGRRAFSGDDVAETIGAVIHKDPAWADFPATVPGGVRRTIERCLEKDPKRRLRDIADVRWDLDEHASSLAALTPAIDVAKRRRGASTWIAWTAAVASAFVAGIGWWRLETAKSAAGSAIELTIVPPSATVMQPVGNLSSAPVISPDGSAVLYLATGGLYVRRLDSLQAIHVAGSEAATNNSFWSPDSQSVLFPSFDSTPRLTRVRLPDGAPEALMPLDGPTRGGSVSTAGTVVMSEISLQVRPASGGETRAVATAGLPAGALRYPEFLPDTEDLIFYLVPSDGGGGEEYLATLRDGSLEHPVSLMANPTAAHYTAADGGELLFVRNDNLYSQRLDRGSRKLVGEPELVVDGVASQPGNVLRAADFSVARMGTVAWRPGRAALAQMTVFDRQGAAMATAGRPQSQNSVALSPNGQRVIAGVEPASILDLSQAGQLALPDRTEWLAWNQDGSRVRGIDASDHIVERSVEGVGDSRVTGDLPAGVGRILDLSSDGRALVAIGDHGLRYVRLAGGSEAPSARDLVDTGTHVRNVRLSSDGRWIVYVDEDAGFSVYAQPVPGPGRRRLVAPNGVYPLWRGDGKEIVYLDLTRDSIWGVAVTATGTDLVVGEPHRLFGGIRLAPGTNSSSHPFDVSRDGSRFVLPQALEQPDGNLIHVLIRGLATGK